MPDQRSHRGPAPEDARLFAPRMWPRLRQATQDLCWLLSRGYAIRSAAELVGNRYSLCTRQRFAVGRSACSDQAREQRRRKEVEPPQLRNQDLWIDGFNVLTGLEAALSGGVILGGCDGCFRDLASVHARHHQVQETSSALALVADSARAWAVRQCFWWLDRPVANSGRLKRQILDLAASQGSDWPVELVWSPDKILAETGEIIATSDSAILDRCQRWLNLTRWIIERHIPRAQVVDLA